MNRLTEKMSGRKSRVPHASGDEPERPAKGKIIVNLAGKGLSITGAAFDFFFCLFW
jgi:hypothetical protein